MGRFLSPDWSAKVEPVPYSKLDDPQTLNLYAYVGNNPMIRIDPDGHAPLSWGGFENCAEPGGCNNSEAQLQQRMESQANAEAQKAWQQSAIMKTATVVYHETGGLRPKAGETTATDLHNVRVDAATVFDHYPRAFDLKHDLSPLSSEAKKTAAWEDSVSAASDAFGKTNIGNHWILYDPAINYPHTPWMSDAYAIPEHSYAGFINAAGGGDVPRGDVVNPLVMQDLTYRERTEYKSW